MGRVMYYFAIFERNNKYAVGNGKGRQIGRVVWKSCICHVVMSRVFF